MGLDSLLARLSGQAVTSVTSANIKALQLDTPSPLGCTPVTSVTSANTKTENIDIAGFSFTEPERLKGEFIIVQSPMHTKTKRPPDEALACFGIGFRWAGDHLPELLATGWTRRELFGRGRYSWPLGNEWGLAWADSWQDERKTATIGEHGKIIFSFLTANGDQAQHSVVRWQGNGEKAMNNVFQRDKAKKKGTRISTHDNSIGIV